MQRVEPLIGPLKIGSNVDAVIRSTLAMRINTYGTMFLSLLVIWLDGCGCSPTPSPSRNETRHFGVWKAKSLALEFRRSGELLITHDGQAAPLKFHYTVRGRNPVVIVLDKEDEGWRAHFCIGATFPTESEMIIFNNPDDLGVHETTDVKEFPIVMTGPIRLIRAQPAFDSETIHPQ